MSDKEFIAALKDMDNDTLIDNLEDLGGDGYYQELRFAIIAEIRKRLAVPKREKGEQLYSDLLRVKHNTMSIDSLIDKVYADMRGKDNDLF